MEQKLVRVKFDVELAKKITSGDIPGKVVTRDGRDSRIVCWDKKSDSNYHIVALLDINVMEKISTYNVKGLKASEEECDDDLFLKIPEYLTYKEGDIIYGEVDNGGGDYCKWLSIIKEIDCVCDQPYVVSYVEYNLDSAYNCGGLEWGKSADNFDIIRPATEEEEAKFAERLKASESPTAKEYLEKYFGIKDSPKVSNSKRKEDFNPFDRVLVRQSESDKWEAMLFSNYTDKPHRYRCGGMNYMFCIPYEGNESLVDTNKSE